MVERSMSELPGGASRCGPGSEYSKRSSYSEGDLVVRRQQAARGGERERGKEQKEEKDDFEELDTFLMDLKDMTDGLDSVLQEGESYSTLQHGGPQRKNR